MNEFDNSLKEALTANGGLSEEKVSALREQAKGQFFKKMKTIERIAFAYLILCTLIAGVAWNNLIQVGSVQLQIVFAIIFLIFFETTVLLKLWYWVVNNKLTVLKEIQFLRLGVSDENSFSDTDSSFVQRGKYLSKAERIVYQGLLIGLCVVLFGLLPDYDRVFGNQSRNTYVRATTTLQADGNGRSVRYQSSRLGGMFPKSEFTYYSGKAARNHQGRWYDSKDRLLQSIGVEECENIKYTVFLIEPTLPGQWDSIRHESEAPALAHEKDGVWSFNSDYLYSSKTHYTQTVVLPAGAQVVSADPKPTSIQETEEGLSVVWVCMKDKNTRFTYKVDYRLD